VRAVPIGGLTWVALGIILAVFAAAVAHLHPTNFFGLFEDDSIYFSSAKALARGQGYILPSVPGTPPATKYPILYPLILSLVWRWNPSFPANLADAVGITTAFGAAYILAGFFFLRRLRSFGTVETLGLTAFCAWHPLVLFFSGNLLSDIPFAALALTAMILADRCLEVPARPWLVVACGVIAGLSMFMRIFGVAVVAGILIAALTKRAWGKMLAIAGCVSPFFAVIGWRNIFHTAMAAPAAVGSEASLGWVRAWAYYTSYLAMWKLSVPNFHIFWAMVGNNLGLVAQAPADLFLSPLMVDDTMAGRALVLVVSLLTFGGIIRQGASAGWRTFHYVLPFFVLMILFWNYSDAGNRFLLPFYFLFAAGFWVEMKHLVAMLRKELSKTSGPMKERILAAVLGLGVMVLSVGMAVNYAAGRRRDLYTLSKQRGELLKAKREAYRWLAQRTEQQKCCSPVVAAEDANLYLYTGRMAISPVLTFATSTLYQQKYLDESLDHLMDVANAAQAELWVFTEDDFAMESKNVATAAKRCLGSLGPEDWPVVFRSSDGRVVVRSLGDKNFSQVCGIPA
jgi:hypothetical protein